MMMTKKKTVCKPAPPPNKQRIHLANLTARDLSPLQGRLAMPHVWVRVKALLLRVRSHSLSSRALRRMTRTTMTTSSYWMILPGVLLGGGEYERSLLSMVKSRRNDLGNTK